MKSILFFVFILASISIEVNHAEIDCSIYTNDLDIINENPFYIPLFSYPQQTSVYYNTTTFQVKEFRIVNDVNPLSNIYCLKHLETLQLTNTNLTILPEIKNFQKLRSLTISSDNGMIGQHLPSEFGQLKSLVSLTLNDIKNLIDLPKEIGYLTQLQSLTLQQIPNFKHISDEHFGQLINLRELNLNNLPNISHLPSTMRNFQSLEKLELIQTNIEHMKFFNLTRLSTLKISLNPTLNDLLVSDMSKLLSLNIQENNQLLTLKLHNLSALQSLTIYSNKQLNSTHIEDLSSIQTISISSSLDLKTMTLKNLSSLNLLELTSLPKLEFISIENASLLSTVRIKGNTLLETVHFHNTPFIKQLDLSQCRLKSFPESILSLKSLTTLILSSNQISSLPLTLANDLPNLQILDLAANQLQGKIFYPTLSYLRELYLTSNGLTSMEGISELKSLQRLELDFNQISSIPMEIMKLSSTLNRFSINSNQLTSLPYSMTNMRMMNMLSATNNQIPLNERNYLNKIFKATSKITLYLSSFP